MVGGDQERKADHLPASARAVVIVPQPQLEAAKIHRGVLVLAEAEIMLVGIRAEPGVHAQRGLAAEGRRRQLASEVLNHRPAVRARRRESAVCLVHLQDHRAGFQRVVGDGPCRFARGRSNRAPTARDQRVIGFGRVRDTNDVRTIRDESQMASWRGKNPPLGGRGRLDLVLRHRAIVGRLSRSHPTPGNHRDEQKPRNGKMDVQRFHGRWTGRPRDRGRRFG